MSGKEDYAVAAEQRTLIVPMGRVTHHGYRTLPRYSKVRYGTLPEYVLHKFLGADPSLGHGLRGPEARPVPRQCLLDAPMFRSCDPFGPWQPMPCGEGGGGPFDAPYDASFYPCGPLFHALRRCGPSEIQNNARPGIGKRQDMWISRELVWPDISNGCVRRDSSPSFLLPHST